MSPFLRVWARWLIPRVLGGVAEFGTAQAVWMSLIELALFASTLLWVASVRWKWSTWMAVVTLGFSVLWFPAFAALVHAQFAAVAALLLAAALAAIRRGRDAVGGLRLALCLFKPQLGIGLVLYAVVWAIAVRRGALLGWLITGIVALVGASLILEPDWLRGRGRPLIYYTSLPVGPSPVAGL